MYFIVHAAFVRIKLMMMIIESRVTAVRYTCTEYERMSVTGSRNVVYIRYSTQ